MAEDESRTFGRVIGLPYKPGQRPRPRVASRRGLRFIPAELVIEDLEEHRVSSPWQRGEWTA